MVEVQKSVYVPVVAPTVTPAPAIQAQPTPAVSGDSSTDAKPSTDAKQVPLLALQEERSRRQEEHSRAESLERELAELRNIVSQTQQQQQFQQQQQQPPSDPRKELEQVWDDDPKKAVRMEIMYAMDWRDRIDSSLEVQADQLARKYPDFNNHRSTALGQVRGLSLNQRGSAGVLEAAYFMVRGQNVDSLLKQRETELLEKYRRGEISAQGFATPPGAFTSAAPIEQTQLTQEQSDVAAAMGLTPEQYASAIKQ